MSLLNIKLLTFMWDFFNYLDFRFILGFYLNNFYLYKNLRNFLN